MNSSDQGFHLSLDVQRAQYGESRGTLGPGGAQICHLSSDGRSRITNHDFLFILVEFPIFVSRSSLSLLR